MRLRTQVGTRIRALRKQQGLSMEVLASRAELSDKYLGQVERGHQAPTLDTIEKIAKGLHVEPYELFVGTPKTRRQLRAHIHALLTRTDDATLPRIVAALQALLH